MPPDLWALDLLRPQIKEMVQYKWELTEVLNQSSATASPIRDSDWDRMRFYSSRITHLALSHCPCSLSRILPSLSAALPETLFPNVQILAWPSGRDGEELPHIRMFLRPTLTSLSFGALSHSAAPVLAILPTKCPRITTLYATAVDMHDLLTGIATSLSCNSLTHIGIGSRYSTHVILHRDLQLLKPFSNLTDFHIGSPLGFDLDDDAVLDLVRTWPQLRSCSFEAISPTHTPRTTLRCLYYFAQHCRHLHILAIPFDATTVPSFVLPPGLDGQHPLVHIDVEQSPVTDTAIAVAQFLSAVLPRLREITTRREYDNNNKDDLEDDLEDDGVEALLPAAVHME
ncbi:hypothetical protein B0H16DRAFT_1894404, partial [Mycena metata]